MTMNAHWREENNMNEMVITATKALTEPKYGRTAAGLLVACRNFYQNPENEAEFQKWKKGGKRSENVLGSGDRVPDRERGGDHRNGDSERMVG